MIILTVDWRLVGTEHPPPHQKYIVRRNGLLFTATPCYGMHDPWWVVRLMPDEWPNEAEPVSMRNDDVWATLSASWSVLICYYLSAG